MLDVEVAGRDLTNLFVQLQPGMTVAGRVVFYGTAARPTDLRTVRIALSPSIPTAGMGGSPATALTEDGTFVITGVIPGKYRLSAFVAAAPTPWILRSTLIDGRDSLDDPIAIAPGQHVTGAVVTFTDHPAELSGTLSDAQGRPATELFVVAFPTDRKLWAPGSRRIATTRPATTGLFRLLSLPPGDYYLCALTDLDPTVDLTDANFLEQLIPASAKVVLGEGEKKVQNLNVGGG